ncbi:MAG TPA: hypothetical protein VK179_21315 [Bacteroidales bacterium]|nr:hypothetical protein [Bacteroidales bacterium]
MLNLRVVFNIKYIILLSAFLASCESSEDKNKNEWRKFFLETDPQTNFYISSMAQYDEETIIFSTYKYLDKNPLYIVRNDSMIAIDTSNIENELSNLKVFYSSEKAKIWINDYCILCYTPNSSTYRYWEVSNINGRNSGYLKMDINGDIWSSSYNGIWKYTNQRSEQFFPGKFFSEICLDKSKNIYIGTVPDVDQKGYLLKFNYYKWDTIYTCNSNSFCISSMSFDNSNYLWCGVMSRSYIGNEYGGGVIKLGERVQEFNILNSDLTSNSVVELNIDMHDNVWIGTYSGGICKLQKDGKWVKYYFQNNIGLGQNFEHILVDDFNNIWASLQFFGLVQFQE